jgi:hypothetical protein
VELEKIRDQIDIEFRAEEKAELAVEATRIEDQIKGGSAKNFKIPQQKSKT